MSDDVKKIADKPEYDDDFDQDVCWNCGGEGFFSNCFQEFACMYPDDGCDECTRRCDVCAPVPAKSGQDKLTKEDVIELRNVLSEAIEDAALKEKTDEA